LFGTGVGSAKASSATIWHITRCAFFVALRLSSWIIDTSLGGGVIRKKERKMPQFPSFRVKKTQKNFPRGQGKFFVCYDEIGNRFQIPLSSLE